MAIDIPAAVRSNTPRARPSTPWSSAAVIAP